MLQECALPTKIGSSPLVQTRGQSKSPELAGLVLAHDIMLTTFWMISLASVLKELSLQSRKYAGRIDSLP